MLIAALGFLAVPAPASGSAYYHFAKHYSVPSREIGKLDVTRSAVFSASTHRRIWLRTLTHNVNVGWDRSHRAIAIFDGNWRLTYWIAAGRVRTIKVPSFKDGFGEPPGYEDSIKWAPDRRRVLIRVAGTQGEMTWEKGSLLCIDLKDGKTVAIADSVVVAHWESSGKVSYKQLVFHEGRGYDEQRLRRWHVKSR